MDRVNRLLVENWTADYGDGHVEPISVPHAWRQSVPVTFEGPVFYRTEIETPRRPSKLRFHGVSYAAEVFIDNEAVASHRGIWDAFDVPLPLGKRVTVEVRVVKNGGASYPVREVASGFLPYVFHTFGGLYREVEILDSTVAPTSPSVSPSRVSIEGHKIFVDGRPFYPRGILHWGWYPELGHPNPPQETVRGEVRVLKDLGFNLVKFCLWTPPHRFLDVLREEGMEAWMELPLWNPTDDPHRRREIEVEFERIVRQYRHHDNIIGWTVGCELNATTSPEFRSGMVSLVENLTGCPLVKDNSGGAEMYGGDLREFGSFDDFHPYCDLPFFPLVLDSLLPGPRPTRPLLLGEFNDVDSHRDLARLADEMPFWQSALSELNDPGVRWAYELPRLLPTNRFAREPRDNRHEELMESSRGQALFVRKFVQEAVRARDPISGYVITGLRDTPISTSGMFTDWGEAKHSPEAVRPWNGPTILFQIPVRRPPWVAGGNRPGWADPFNHFVGQIFFRIGVHSEHDIRAGLIWTIARASGEEVARGTGGQISIAALESREVGQISWACDEPGAFVLRVEFGDTVNQWPVHVFTRPEGDRVPDWIGMSNAVGTIPAPFWREAAYEFKGEAFDLAQRWERFASISPDCVLDPDSLPSDCETIINRIDTRTYKEHPILVRAGDRFLTTLRLEGGLGIQPIGLRQNPSAVELIRRLGLELGSRVQRQRPGAAG